MHTPFASDVKELTESNLFSRLPQLSQWDEKYPINKAITLMDEEGNDSTCKSLYRVAYTKYRYLRENNLVLPTFLASQYLAYYLLWPAGTDLSRVSGLIALQPYMAAFAGIVYIFALAYVFLDEPPTDWRSRKYPHTIHKGNLR